MLKPVLPLGCICCGTLPDLSGALCGICEDGECKQRGEAGHLPPLARCGAVLSVGDCQSLSVVISGGSGDSIAYKYRHSCREGKQITVSAVNLVFMLSPLSLVVRSAFLASAQAWFVAKQQKAAAPAAGGGAARGGDGKGAP